MRVESGSIDFGGCCCQAKSVHTTTTTNHHLLWVVWVGGRGGHWGCSVDRQQYIHTVQNYSITTTSNTTTLDEHGLRTNPKPASQPMRRVQSSATEGCGGQWIMCESIAWTNTLAGLIEEVERESGRVEAAFIFSSFHPSPWILGRPGRDLGPLHPCTLAFSWALLVQPSTQTRFFGYVCRCIVNANWVALVLVPGNVRVCL